MLRFERVLKKEKPDLVVVVGDVNSTLACSLAATKLNIKVAHVEAGLRSFNWSMPEEINRVLTDKFSDYLFTTEENANENLINEGILKKNIHFVGNIMIDTLIQNMDRIINSKILELLGLNKNEYCLLTLHRPQNVDNLKNLLELLNIFKEVQSKIKIIFPAHPRTLERIKEFKLEQKIKNMKNFILIKPVGYINFLNLYVGI